MKILFVHQNCPGQYRHLAPRLAADPANEVVFLTKPGKPDLPGVRKVEHQPTRQPSSSTHRYLRLFEDGVLHGQSAARAAVTLRDGGFRPDVICGHMGWGEALYLKEVWPASRLLGYFEFYYHGRGADVGFDPASPPTLDDLCRIRTRNGLHLLNLEAADWGITPTHWQWRQHPSEWRHKISVVHDGVDTAQATPDPGATLPVGAERVLRAGDEVVTYVARNLEPYRGFPTFMRAAALVLERRPKAHVVVVGGDGVSYGSPPPGGQTWREVMLREVAMDPARVHFLGRVPYPTFLRVLQVSAVHVYLTYPFVLSWSMLEAMAAGCLVVGSRTAPVTEIIEHGRNGLLVDFFSQEALASQIELALQDPLAFESLRTQARSDMTSRYALDVCLRQQLDLIETVARGERPHLATHPTPQRVGPGKPTQPGNRKARHRRR